MFSVMFERDLNNCGLTTGMQFSKMNAQWFDMRRKKHSIWLEVHVQSPFSKEGRWASVIKRIRQTVQHSGAVLNEREADLDVPGFVALSDRKVPLQVVDSSTGATTANGQAESPADITSPSSDTAPTSLSEAPTQLNLRQPSLSKPLTCSRENFISAAVESICTAGGKKCLWCHQEGPELVLAQVRTKVAERLALPGVKKPAETVLQQAPLLFRWWNVNSQGVNSKPMLISGLFSMNGAELLHPTHFSQEKFDSMFKGHVGKAHVPSPFISAFGTPLAPIHRGIHNERGATMSIIETLRLETEVFSAEQLVRETNFQWPRYRGLNEYLIWGKVPPAAIICTVEIQDLQKIADEHLDVGDILQLDVLKSYRMCGKPLKRALKKGPGKLDQKCGFSIGKLLGIVGVPEQHIGNVASSIARSWMFQQGSRDDFMGGVHHGYLQFSPSVSQHPKNIVSNFIEINDNEEGERSSAVDSPCPSRSVQHMQPTSPESGPLSSRSEIPRYVKLINPNTRAWSVVSKTNTRLSADNFPQHDFVGLVSDGESDLEEDDGNEPDEEGEDDVAIGRPNTVADTFPEDQFGAERARVRQILAQNSEASIGMMI